MNEVLETFPELEKIENREKEGEGGGEGFDCGGDGVERDCAASYQRE